MKTIKQWILKRIKHYFDHKCRIVNTKYFFCRWLIEVCQDSTAYVGIVYNLVLLHEKNLDLWSTICQVMEDMFVIDGTVYIVTFRPGVIIGKGGQQIEEFKAITGYSSVNLIETRTHFNKALVKHTFMVLEEY